MNKVGLMQCSWFVSSIAIFCTFRAKHWIWASQSRRRRPSIIKTDILQPLAMWFRVLDIKSELARTERVTTGRNALSRPAVGLRWQFQVLVFIYRLERIIFKLWEHVGLAGSSDLRIREVHGPTPTPAKVIFSHRAADTCVLFASSEWY